jgi:hypothetical protein
MSHSLGMMLMEVGIWNNIWKVYSLKYTEIQKAFLCHIKYVAFALMWLEIIARRDT